MRAMYSRESVLFAFVILTFLGAKGIEFRRVCYHTNWSIHRGGFKVSDIDPDLCTHIIYAFANLDIENTKLIPSETADDNGSLTDKRGNYFDFTNLKKKNPKLKTLLSVGGENAKTFPRITINQQIMDVFAENCKIFLRDRNFDGIDIDWEYPMEASRDGFTNLLKALRTTFDKEELNGRSPLMITIATAAGKKYIDESYNIPEIIKYVDFFNVMAYDYAGTWSTMAAFGSPLYSRISNCEFNVQNSQNWTMHYYIELGVPKDKLVMGIRGAGASFALNDPKEHGLGAQLIKGGGDPGSIRELKGHLAYFEVCVDMLKKGASHVWDQEQRSNYAYLADQWVGYDDPRSVVEKVKYAKIVGLGGVMFWSFDYDDFTGDYCSNGSYPLLSAIKRTANSALVNATLPSPPDRSQCNSGNTVNPAPVQVTLPPLPVSTTERPSVNDGSFRLFKVTDDAVGHTVSFLCLVSVLIVSLLIIHF